MAVAVKVAGSTAANAPRGHRYKTAGPGTKRVFDFKYGYTYPDTVTNPTTSIPTGALLNDLPDLSVTTPANTASVLGSGTVQSADGGLVNAAWGQFENVRLPSEFKLPAHAGESAHYLIIMAVYMPNSAAASGAEGIAGWADNTGSLCNWAIARNNGNANTFAFVGTASVNWGALSVGWHRLALEIIKTPTAVTLRAFQAGLLFQTSAPFTTYTDLRQPTTAVYAQLGRTGFASAKASTKYGSIELRDLTLDTMTVEDIVAADYAKWGARFV